MAKLTSSKRNSLKKSQFGIPGKRAFPLNDKTHAANAKACASEAVNKGTMSKALEARIDKKADRVLGRGK